MRLNSFLQLLCITSAFFTSLYVNSIASPAQENMFQISAQPIINYNCPLTPGTVAWCDADRKTYFITSVGGTIELSMRAYALMKIKDSRLRITRQACWQIAQCQSPIITTLMPLPPQQLISPNPAFIQPIPPIQVNPIKPFNGDSTARCILTINNQRYNLDRYIATNEHPVGSQSITNICYNNGDLVRATRESGNRSHRNVLTLIQPFLADGSIRLMS
jgi:hypothetical protein